MRLGLREANQQFSKVINAVRAGREVVLTERGRAIALIKPIEKEDAEGLITPASRKGPMPPPHWRPVRIKGEALSQTIIEDREDRA